MSRSLLVSVLLALLLVAGHAQAIEPVLPVQSGEKSLGSDKAPVTVIEYASLSCPHCARWETEVFPQVQRDLIDTGKVRYVFRDFPLNGSAVRAALLAHCDPDKFYSFLEVLFGSQSVWAASENPDPELARIASLGGIGPDRFQACLKDETEMRRIVSSRQAGEAAGVDGTPYFFINGKGHSGELDIQAFTALVMAANK